MDADTLIDRIREQIRANRPTPPSHIRLDFGTLAHLVPVVAEHLGVPEDDVTAEMLFGVVASVLEDPAA